MLEGYLLTGSAANSKALYSALKKAKQSGAKIAFLASADFVIQAKRSEIIKEVLPSCDMVFYNQSEALLLTEKPDIERATQSCALLTPSSVITLGSRGAIVNIEGNIYTASAHPPKAAVIDTTGAGDVFAGALLAGLMRGLPVNLAAEGASGLASRITTRRGAQLQREDYHLWESITTASNMDA
jgi:sugar/nucleoside kinase (ribokinase family)